MDADKRVTPELKKEILELLSRGSDRAAYEIPFHFYFLGRRLRFGNPGFESHVRLFDKNRARFVGGLVHEGLSADGNIARLNGGIEHYSYRDLSEYLDKPNAYSSAAARDRYNAGRHFAFQDHLRPLWDFLRAYLFKLGFLDGQAGLAWAGLSAFHNWVKYAKLEEIEETLKNSRPL